MATDRIYIVIYWQDRKETAAECAQRAAQLLAHLAQTDPALGAWFQLGRSRKDALRRPVATNIASLEKLCRRGIHRTDMPPRKIMVELGFHISIWNGGNDGETAGLRIEFGAYNNYPYMPFPNYCKLELPANGPAGERLHRLEPILVLMEGIAKAIDALWGVAMTSKLQDIRIEKEQAMDVKPVDQADVGWVTYLAAHARAEEAAAVVAQELPQLPPPVRTADGGVLLLTTQECFNVDSPAHLAAAEDLERVLKGHGLLTFAPPARKKRSGRR